MAIKFPDDIEWTEWTQDILDEDGNVLDENVRFIRGSLRVTDGVWIEYHAPIYAEDEDWPGIIDDAKQILTMKIAQAMLDGAIK